VKKYYYQLDKAPSNPTLAPAVVWDPKYCNTDLAITDHGRTITKKQGGWWGACLCVAVPDTPSFRVCVKGGNDILLGYAILNAFRSDDINHTRSGWFLYCHTGHLYSCYGHSDTAYTTAISENSIVVVNLDKASRTISYEVDGEEFGIAFRDIDFGEGPLLPCAEISGESSVTLLDVVGGENIRGCTQACRDGISH